MLLHDTSQNQEQNSSKLLSLSSLPTQDTRYQSLEFINASPPIDEALSKHLEEKLLEYEKQERANAKEKSRYEAKYGKPPQSKSKSKRTKRDLKAENRHRLIYTTKLFDIAYIKSNPSRQTIANISGVHVNTFDNHKKELQTMNYLAWKSGKKTWETNIYELPDHVKLQTITRPKDFSIPRFLFLAIQKVLKKLNWDDQQTIYKQLIKDLVHHITLRVRKKRTSLDKNEKKCATGPPKTRAGPRRHPFRKILEPLKLSFRDQAILSSYGEGPLRAAINDLESYSGTVRNTAAFLISRCKSIKNKMMDIDKEIYASAEENINWLKEKLSDEKLQKKIIFESENEIDRTSQCKKPYVNLLIHKTQPEKSKLVINQKVNGHWIDKTITLSSERFRTAVMETLERAFKHSGSSFKKF